MATSTHRQSVEVNGTVLASTTTFTGTLIDVPAQSCSTGATTVINLAVDVSATKSFSILSTRNVTVKTNSADTPDDTLTLVADVAYIWTTSSYDAFLLETDVETLHVVNASGASASVAVSLIVDSTP